MIKYIREYMRKWDKGDIPLFIAIVGVIAFSSYSFLAKRDTLSREEAVQTEKERIQKNWYAEKRTNYHLGKRILALSEENQALRKDKEESVPLHEARINVPLPISTNGQQVTFINFDFSLEEYVNAQAESTSLVTLLELSDEIKNHATYFSATQEIGASMQRVMNSKEKRAAHILHTMQLLFMQGWQIKDQKDNRVQYPIETLVSRTGTEADYALLGASLCKAAGLDVALLHFHEGTQGNAVALGIAGAFEGRSYHLQGKEYYVADIFTPSLIGANLDDDEEGMPIVYQIK